MLHLTMKYRTEVLRLRKFILIIIIGSTPIQRMHRLEEYGRQRELELGTMRVTILRLSIQKMADSKAHILGMDLIRQLMVISLRNLTVKQQERCIRMY